VRTSIAFSKFCWEVKVIVRVTASLARFEWPGMREVFPLQYARREGGFMGMEATWQSMTARQSTFETVVETSWE
jgi:hypothetical protein